jgi:putative transposase
VTRTYKYRIYPNDEQAQQLARFFGCVRKMYNLCLDWWTEAYQLWKDNGTPFGKTPDYGVFAAMEEYFYLTECDKVALQQARRHFEKAIKDYLKSKKGQRDGRRLGFPQHKKRGKCRDSYTTYNNSDCIRVIDDRYITLPKLGSVKIKLHRSFEGHIKYVCVSRTGSGQHYVSLTVDAPEEQPLVNRVANAANPKVVGLDMSLQSLVVSSEPSDDAIPKRVRLYRKDEKRLARLQRSVSRKVFKSKNRDKARKRLAREHERIAAKRRENAIQTALHYVRKYDVVVIEDLDMQSMSRSLRLGKSVIDIAFGEFRQWLEWEAHKYDCYVCVADKWFASSKTCHECGHKNESLALSDRVWTCPSCGAELDRDRNAAINLRQWFEERYSTAGTAGIHACGDFASTLRDCVGRALSMKQEAAELIQR